MQGFLQILVVATIIEALVQVLKPVYDREKGWNRDLILALFISMLVCALTKADVVAYLGMPFSVPYVGSIMTGVLVSRGTNFIHDLLTSIQGMAGGIVAMSSTAKAKAQKAAGKDD